MQDLQVEPAVLQSGDVVKVQAIVANLGDTPAHSLRLGLAVAGAGTNGRRWTPIAINPAEPVELLSAGERVHFSGTARLEGDGVYRVGIMGQSEETVLPPQGQTVRVIEIPATLTELGALFGSYIALLSIVLEPCG